MTKLYREPVQIVWPFKFVNGQQTDQSRALMLDKEAQKPSGACVQFDLSTVEDALL